MKDKILVFMMGMLVGAIITASAFLVYQKVQKNTNQMPSGEQMQMMERPDGNSLPPAMPNGETQPEKPSGIENDSNNVELPSSMDSLNSTSVN